MTGAGFAMGGPTGALIGAGMSSKARETAQTAYKDIGGAQGLSGIVAGGVGGYMLGGPAGALIGAGLGSAMGAEKGWADKRARQSQFAYEQAAGQERERATQQNRANLLSLRRNLERTTSRATQGGAGGATATPRNEGGIVLG